MRENQPGQALAGTFGKMSESQFMVILTIKHGDRPMDTLFPIKWGTSRPKNREGYPCEMSYLLVSSLK